MVIEYSHWIWSLNIVNKNCCWLKCSLWKALPKRSVISLTHTSGTRNVSMAFSLKTFQVSGENSLRIPWELGGSFTKASLRLVEQSWIKTMYTHFHFDFECCFIRRTAHHQQPFIIRKRIIRPPFITIVCLITMNDRSRHFFWLQFSVLTFPYKCSRV